MLLKVPRHQLLTLVVISLVLSLAGAAYAKTTITLLAGNISESAWNEAVAAFERDNPDIAVEPIYVGWDQTDDKFVTMVAGGTPPDVFLQNSVYGWARYVHEGLLMDLTPLLDRFKGQTNYNDVLAAGWRAAKVGNKLGGFAGIAPGFSVNYNATLFEEAGLALPPTNWNDSSWNWNTMLTYAKRLTRVNSEGAATQYGVDFWDADNLIGYAWAFGGDWFSPDSYTSGIVGMPTLNTPANVRGYEQVAALRTDLGVRPGGRIPAATPISGVGSFQNGLLGMWIDGVSVARPDAQPQVKAYKWGFAPFPFPEGAPRDRTFSWSGAYAGIAAGSKHPEEAWRLLVYLTGQIKDPAVRGVLYMNPRVSNWLYTANEWIGWGIMAQTPQAVQEVLFGSLERAAPLPRSTVVGATEVWNVVNPQLSPALRGQVSVAEALQKAQPIAEAAVAELKAKLKPQ